MVAISNYTNNVTTPLYLFVLPFESEELIIILDKILIKYPYISYAVGLTYVFLTFLIQKMMRSRDSPFKLTYFAFAWNCNLAMTNALAFCRLLPYTFRTLTEFGWRVSICTDRLFMIDWVCGTWLALFPFIKIIELGDTFILVLQKRRLDPYFWCHHLFALLGSWYIYSSYPTLSVWLCLIVYGSHVPIYVYSCLRSINVTLPKVAPFFLIFVELLTVFSGAVLCSLTLYYISHGENCYVSTFPVIVLELIFVTCFALGNLLLFKKLHAATRKNRVFEVKM